MKKLLTLLTMALIAICANAQAVIGEIDWSTEEVFNNWCSGENGSTAVVGAEGLEINVPAAGENYWNPQTVVLNIAGEKVADNPDAPAFLAEDGRYQVIITAKHPAGHLQVNLGTWDDGVSLQKDFDVAEAADFEDIVVDFSDGWPADCFSNVHVLWQCGALPGLSVLKKVQIIDLDVNSNYDTWTIAGDKNLFGSDWDATDKKNNMSTYDGINYTLTKSTYLPKGTYKFKVYKDNKMQESYPRKNATLVINEEAFYNVKFTFNSNTKKLSATATKKEILFYNYIPKGKVAEVKSIASSFKGDLTIPSSVIHDGEKYTVSKISDNTFANYGYLNSVTIPNSVTSIGSSAFKNCSGLTSVTIGNSVTSIGESAFYGCGSLVSVNIPKSVTSIGSYAFYGCGSLVSANIPKSVTSIGSYAFFGCRGLTSFKVENGNQYYDSRNDCNALIETASNTLIVGCNNSTIPNSVTSIGYCAFSGRAGLTSITIPNSVTSIGVGAFASCSRLTSVNIPNSVTSIGGGAFEGCSRLTSVDIPNSVISVGLSAFRNCSGLTSVTIGNSVTSIREGTFYGCSSLTSLTIPNSVIILGEEDEMDGPFENCTSLTSVTIPNSVTEIWEGAFRGCKALASITIGCRVKNIYYGAFADCPELTDVYCYAENPTGDDPWDADDDYGLNTSYSAFMGSYIEYATLHVPKGCLDAYKAVKPWKNFKSIVDIVDAKVELSKTEATIEKGKTLTLKATITPSDLADKSVTWKSSNKKVATVSSSGKVKGVKAGTATITCTSNATGLKATCTVTVVNGVVTLNKTEACVQKGKTVTLKATVTPKTLADKSVTWKSSNKNVVTVTKAGKVKGVKYGTATITCTSVATGAKATCQVTVGKVVIGTSEVTIKKSRETILIPFLYPEDLADKSVTWKSSDKSIATVDEDGRVKGIKAGTATITCTSVATGLKGTCTVTVLSNSEARSMIGDDDELTDIKELESSAVAEPFDVYDLSGRKVLHQVTSLDGLSDGIYIVNGKKILKKK